MNDKTMVEKLLRNLKEYDRKHKRVRDDDMFEWFYEDGLTVLKVYTDLEYHEDIDGINVDIITDSLVLYPDLEDNLVEVLLKAGKCEVKTVNNQLHIHLWYCGWKDVEIG